MAEQTIYESIEGKKGVRIEQDGDYLALLWMRNGFQWQGGGLDRDILLRIHAAIESALPDAFSSPAASGMAQAAGEGQQAAGELLEMIEGHQYGLRGFGDGSLSRGRNLTDNERWIIRKALALYAASPAVAPSAQPVRMLTRAEVDEIVYQCRQAGDDTTYAIVHAALVAAIGAAPSAQPTDDISRAADFLEQYAGYIREVKLEDIERHPYLPELEAVAASLRAIGVAPSAQDPQAAELAAKWDEPEWKATVATMNALGYFSDQSRDPRITVARFAWETARKQAVGVALAATKQPAHAASLQQHDRQEGA